jgi:membrane peptidoglycan carboxypeptidase
LWYTQPRRRAVLSEATAFMMSSMLADVIESGTGTAARAAGFRLPAAGKTGTTDDYTDAWFIGYTPRLVAGIWFGMDRPAPIMNRGFASIVAVPAWAEFMKRATTGDPASWFMPPSSVEKVAICRLSGNRATEACRHDWRGPEPLSGLIELPGETTGTFASVSTAVAQAMVFEDYFPIGSVPSELCSLHDSAAFEKSVLVSPASTVSDVRLGIRDPGFVTRD